MPSSQEHQAKYKLNRNFLDANAGLAANEPCWAAVVAFYAALHLIERLAARQNRHHDIHGQRARFIGSHPQHYVILYDYELLFAASLVARYGTINQFQRQWPADTVQTVLIDIHLVAIENYVDSVFNPPSPAPPSAGT